MAKAIIMVRCYLFCLLTLALCCACGLVWADTPKTADALIKPSIVGTPSLVRHAVTAVLDSDVCEDEEEKVEETVADVMSSVVHPQSTVSALEPGISKARGQGSQPQVREQELKNELNPDQPGSTDNDGKTGTQETLSLQTTEGARGSIGGETLRESSMHPLSPAASQGNDGDSDRYPEKPHQGLEKLEERNIHQDVSLPQKDTTNVEQSQSGLQKESSANGEGTAGTSSHISEQQAVEKPSAATLQDSPHSGNTINAGNTRDSQKPYASVQGTPPDNLQNTHSGSDAQGTNTLDKGNTSSQEAPGKESSSAPAVTQPENSVITTNNSADSDTPSTPSNEESTSTSTTTTTTTTLPPTVPKNSNNKKPNVKGNADSSSISSMTSVWVRMPLLIVVTLACILV